MVFCESVTLDDLPLIKSSLKNEFLQRKNIIDRFDDMKNIAANRLEDWLEEDEDISQNLDFKEKVFIMIKHQDLLVIKKKMTLDLKNDKHSK